MYFCSRWTVQRQIGCPTRHTSVEFDRSVWHDPIQPLPSGASRCGARKHCPMGCPEWPSRDFEVWRRGQRGEMWAIARRRRSVPAAGWSAVNMQATQTARGASSHLVSFVGCHSQGVHLRGVEIEGAVPEKGALARHTIGPAAQTGGARTLFCASRVARHGACREIRWDPLPRHTRTTPAWAQGSESGTKASSPSYRGLSVDRLPLFVPKHPPKRAPGELGRLFVKGAAGVRRQ